MTKTLRLLSLAAFLATGVAGGAMAAGNANTDSSQNVTNSQIGGQTAAPATGPARNATGMSAQTTGPSYPGVVGPTGSRQNDATNPNRSGSQGGNNGGGNSGNGGSGTGR